MDGMDTSCHKKARRIGMYMYCPFTEKFSSFDVKPMHIFVLNTWILIVMIS